MATKTYNPTANPFELLHVDEEPEKRPRNPKQKQGGAPPAQPSPAQASPVVMETPAQKSERRAKAKAEKDRQADAMKKQQEQEKALAALIPDEGFQLQKGSQSKKPVDGEKKKTVMNREEYEKNPEQQQTRKFPQQNKTGKTPLQPREPRANDGPIQKQFGNEKRKRDPQGDNPTRPPKHEGYDKQSGQKTTQKHSSKKDGDWGNAVQDWNHGQVTESTQAGAGWGGDDTASQAAATPLSSEGWGGDHEGAAKSQPATPAEDAPSAAPVQDAPPAKQRPPAWDEVEGHGKMLFDEFQKSIAAQRNAALRELAPAKKSRTVDTPADFSKFVEKEVVDAKSKVGGAPVEKKEKKLPQQKPPQPAPKAQPAQPRVNEKQVELNTLFDVRSRPGGGGGGGGRGRGGGPAASRDRGATDRQDRQPQSDNQGKEQGGGSPKPKPQGPRAGYPGGRNKVPGGGSHNQFPDLPTVTKTPQAAPK